MGVYIKGMEMPKNCVECKIRSYDANAEEEYCPFSQIVCLSIGIQDNCPLVSVQEPHGRLIDADYLMEHIYICETNGRPLHIMELDERLACIDEVPTVIESEGE